MISASGFEMDKENARNSNQLLLFSPQKLPVKLTSKTKSICEVSENIPVLQCAPFQSALWIGFGCVQLNSATTKVFELRNEEDSPATVSVVDWDKSSAARAGFSISFGSTRAISVCIQAKDVAMGYITWTPSVDSSVSENAILKLNSRHSLQITLHGISGSGEGEKKVTDPKQRPRSRSSESRTRKPLQETQPRTRSLSNESKCDSLKSIKGLKTKSSGAKSGKSGAGGGKKMTTVSESVTLKKSFVDNNFADKQIAGFTEWMNYTFKKADHNHTPTDIDDVNAATEESDISAIKFIKQKREEAKIRQKAAGMFKSMSNVLSAVDHEVSEGRIALREYPDLLADIGLQAIFCKLLFSYQTNWLRLGLEIVFGEVLSLSSKMLKSQGDESIQWKKVLKGFIFDRFLTDPQISATKTTFTVHGIENKMFSDLRKHILKKFLAFVLLVDHCRQEKLIHTPTLFVKDSEVKSSKDVLVCFCKEFLKGEGDLVRHLSTMQYNVSFTQTYIDEFDYTITNLATDLLDGVRLARLIELLTDKFELSGLLRVPAVSRLQKLHNVGLVTKFVKETGIDSTVSTKNIVGGLRDETLAFLWRIMFHFDVKKTINVSKIHTEVKEIKENREWRKSIYNEDDAAHFAVKVCNAPACDQSQPEAMCTGVFALESKLIESQFSEICVALCDWCNSITEQYSVPVYNLTRCLADGRALCLIIHYYHPTMLPLRSIKKTSANFADPLFSMTRLDEFTETNVTVSKHDLQSAVHNERKNFCLLRKACADIGGIPIMLPTYDSTNIPEEKTIITFLGYLFSRLTETSKEIRAAIRIQRFIKVQFSKKRERKSLKHGEKIKTFKVKPAFVNKFISEVPVAVKMSTKVSEVVAAQLIGRTVLAFLTRCRFLNYLSEKQACEESHKDLLKIKEDAFIVRIAKYGIPKSSFSSFPLSRTELSERLPYGTTPYTPSCTDSDISMVQYSEFSERDRRQSDQFSVISERTNLTNEFIMDDSANEMFITAKLLAEKEAELRTSALMKKYEEDARREIELARIQAEQDAIMKVEEHSQRMYEQLRLAEAQTIERERCAQLDVEIALMKSKEVKANAELDSQLKVQEVMTLSECLIQAEKDARIQAEERCLEQEDAKKAIEERLREVEEQYLSMQKTLQLEKEAEYEAKLRSISEQMNIEKLEREKKEQELILIQNEQAKAAQFAVQSEKEARMLAEEKAAAELQVRLQLEAKLKAIEDKQMAQENERIRLEQERQEFERKETALSITVQTIWRRYTATKRTRALRAEIELKSANEAQALLEESRRKELLHSQKLLSFVQHSRARKIQLAVQVFLISRRCVKEEKSAICIQNFLRLLAKTKRLGRRLTAAIKVQSCVRMFFIRKQLQVLHKSARCIQKIFRGTLVRFEVKQYRMKILLQEAQIAEEQRVLAEIKLMESLECQRVAQLKQKDHASFVITRNIRAFVKRIAMSKCASRLVNWFRSRRGLLRVRILRRGFVRLQALFRSLRTRAASSQRMKDIRSKLFAATAISIQEPHRRLCERTSRALQVLQTSRVISELRGACETLELSTRLSFNCARSFTEVSASKILFALIQSCNRTAPHQELLRYALVILLHVARYSTLAPIVAEADNSTDVVIHMMQMFRDKPQIFCLSGELLCRLVESNQNAKISCNKTDSRKCLEGILHIIETKHRLTTRVSMVSRKANTKDSKETNSPQGGKTKIFSSDEPVNCIRHLMSLLDDDMHE